MSTNIRSQLDQLKVQSINIIARNATIRFPQVQKSIADYISSGGSYFNSMLRFLDFNADLLSSSTISATYLLAYMDFFALYTILFANYPVFARLMDISKSKYEYIYSVYKQLSGDLKQKEILQKYNYCTYENFIYPRYINWELSGFLGRDKRSSKPLSVSPVMTLPVIEQRIISPSSINFTDTDYTNSFSQSLKYLDGFDFTIFRTQNNKIGVADSGKASPFGGNVKYSVEPDVKGTIYGYFADKIYVTITKIEKNQSGEITKITAQGSTTGYEWSSDFDVNLDAWTDINVEDNVAIGLKIFLRNGLNISTGDKWTINVINTNLGYPRIRLKLAFDLLEQMSYIRYTDISPHAISISDAYIDRNKFGDDIENNVQSFKSNIGHIVVSDGTVDEYAADISQYEYDIKSMDGKLLYEYAFKVRNIEGVINKYHPHGTAVLKGMKVSNINTITIESTYKLPKYQEHTEQNPYVPKSLVEFNIIAENISGKVMIPAIEKNEFKNKEDNNRKFYIWDYVIPGTINENNGETSYFGSAYYKPRFPVDIENYEEVLAYQMHDNIKNGGVEYNIEQDIFVVMDYIYSKSVCAWYPVKINKVEDIVAITPNNKWRKASYNIFYMYYLDENNLVHIAIREYDQNTRTLKPFSGTIYGQIEIRSLDHSYKTPMVFDYSVACI